MLTSQQTAYVRWLALPDEYRTLSESELLELLCGPEADRRTFSGWRKSKEFQRALDKLVKEQQDSRDFLSFAMRERTKQQLWHEFRVLSEKEPKEKDDHIQLRQYGKEILDMTKHVEQAGNELPPFEDLPDDELVKLFLDSGLSIATASQAELARLYDDLKGDSCTNSSEASSEPPCSDSASTPVDSTETKPVTTKANPRSPSAKAARAKSSTTTQKR